jgi:hypothetical protein
MNLSLDGKHKSSGHEQIALGNPRPNPLGFKCLKNLAIRDQSTRAWPGFMGFEAPGSGLTIPLPMA